MFRYLNLYTQIPNQDYESAVFNLCVRQMKSVTIFVLCLLAEIWHASGHYEKKFVEDLCRTSEIMVWNLGSGSANSSGILKSSRDGKFLKGLNCTILIQPPLGYGVVLSVRYLDFMPFYPPKCQSFIQILEDDKSPKLCGYSDDVSEYQSYSSEGKGLEIQFVTINQSGPQYHSEFEFIATSYVKLSYDCDMKMFPCENSRCIWKGLTCDGHNNCGDKSDEYPRRRSSCGMMSPGIIAAIVVASVMGFLLLIIIPFACCRCKSRYRSSQGSVLQTTQIQPPTYGSSAVRSDIPYDSRLLQNNLQEELPPEPSSSQGYQDPPPAYKAN